METGRSFKRVRTSSIPLATVILPSVYVRQITAMYQSERLELFVLGRSTVRIRTELNRNPT